ncbi:MAG: glycerol-3-phosphate acyltransferase [Anaerolineaceae bacterium]
MDWLHTPAFIFTALLILSYLIGSIPFGFIFVRLTTGKDIRNVESGRTGGTNALRAGGFWVGFATAVMDALKAAGTVWLAQWWLPGNSWAYVLAPLAAILGHNYSIFLLERLTNGELSFRGGAGGAPCFGGAVGLFPPNFLIILPLAGAIWYGVGYASVATMSIAMLTIIVFLVRALRGLSPWQYDFYGVASEILLMIALIPNIKRLIAGNERLIGWRAKRKERIAAEQMAKEKKDSSQS